jgi:hypothetical protein
MKPRPRKTVNLSESVHQQLNMYALAAGAAGVGLLALAHPAQAKIIYTKTNVRVFNTNHGVPLDLNNDGTADFTFVGFLVEGCTSSYAITALHIAPALAGNAIRRSVTGNGAAGAAALGSGVRVGPNALGAGELLMGTYSYRVCGGGRNHCSGSWEGGGRGVTNRYLGLEFKIKGKRHYGWARLNFPIPFEATLTGYAYETIPNKPIITGKTKGPDDAGIEEFRALRGCDRSGMWGHGMWGQECGDTGCGESPRFPRRFFAPQISRRRNVGTRNVHQFFFRHGAVEKWGTSRVFPHFPPSRKT